MAFTLHIPGLGNLASTNPQKVIHNSYQHVLEFYHMAHTQPQIHNNHLPSPNS